MKTEDEKKKNWNPYKNQTNNIIYVFCKKKVKSNGFEEKSCNTAATIIIIVIIIVF